ncbi:SMI1/KNR4 family protein [Pyxidicoccus caerfyrddinensis]|uniref:SMI1/KNR4 family protein n=1 Tax=Pyxidicoccus caerfyrddinensis TaxID=2709663 RepID=UPI0013D92677|nr:SMI1/KNR4 family protein [Pyxidicoccus caerfyrddinensis]
MHEWLEALRKSAKASSPGVPAEEVRRAETECGVPFPEELGALYQALNGGELNGDVHLFQLHGPEGSASVLEKSRLKLVGLPAAGVWRIGLKGLHRHLFTARKSAMVEQGDGGGPLPGWMDPLGDEDWVYGTWDGEKQELRLYRTLKDMLDVLVPPAEVESFGERTFARAMNAVLQGALSGAEADEEEGSEADSAATEAEAVEAAEAEDLGEEVRELAYEYDDDSRRRRDEERPFAGKKPKPEPKKPARPVGMGASKAKEKPVGRAEPRSPDTGGAGVLLPRAASGTGEATAPAAGDAGAAGGTETAGAETPAAAPAPKKAAKKARAEAAPATEAPGEPAAAPVAPEVKGAEVIAAAKKRVAKKAVTEPTVTAPPAVTLAPTERPAAKKAAAGKPVAAKKAAAAPASKQPAAAKKAPAKKAAAKKAAAATKPVAKKGAAAKKPVAKKAPAKKAAAKKAPAKKAAAKKAAAKKAPVKKGAAAKKVAAKKVAAKKAPAKKAAAKKAPVRKGAAKKAAAKKGTRGR